MITREIRLTHLGSESDGAFDAAETHSHLNKMRFF